MTAIGVFCARVRVEEKQIIAAIGEAGFAVVPVTPASSPLPPGPAVSGGSLLGDLSATNGQESISVLVDRCANRTIAAAMLPLLRTAGATVIDAGIAATGTRLQVAAALALAGIARPASLVGFSEQTANEAAGRLGYPVVLFGLQPGSTSTVLHDADTADAVIEHRVVLGNESEAIVLLQAGAPDVDQRSVVHVVGGKAIAFNGAVPCVRTIALAESAAIALDASLIAIEIATTAEGLVVWDVHPVADFRHAQLVGSVTVGAAIAHTVTMESTVNSTSTTRAEVRHDFALSA